MHYFTEHGDTHAEVLAKVRSKYGSGPEVLISQQREVPVKSIWGKITRSTRWEIHGAILEKNKVQLYFILLENRTVYLPARRTCDFSPDRFDGHFALL